MVNYEMSETEKPNLYDRESPKFFSLKVLRKSSKSEIAIAQRVATTKDSLWFEMEAWFFEHNRIGA